MAPALLKKLSMKTQKLKDRVSRTRTRSSKAAESDAQPAATVSMASSLEAVRSPTEPEIGLPEEAAQVAGPASAAENQCKDNEEGSSPRPCTPPRPASTPFADEENQPEVFVEEATTTEVESTARCGDVCVGGAKCAGRPMVLNDGWGRLWYALCGARPGKGPRAHLPIPSACPA